MGCCKGCDDKPQLSGHPHTVRAPITPLYQLGWLGDDGGDVYGPPETIDTAAINLDTGMTSPGYGMPPIEATLSYPDQNASPDYAPISTPGVVYGPPAPGQPGSIAAASAPSFLTSLTNLFKTPAYSGSLPLGPSPRVGITMPSTISLGSALPLLAIVGIGIVAVSSLGGRR